MTKTLIIRTREAFCRALALATHRPMPYASAALPLAVAVPQHVWTAAGTQGMECTLGNGVSIFTVATKRLLPGRLEGMT